MAYKLATRSSTEKLEEEIKKFSEESGQGLSEIYKRAHALYIGNHERKAKINTNKQGDE